MCVSLMRLVGRRLFATDHLYPYPRGASHHLHHTSHSIKAQGQVCTQKHKWLLPLNFCSWSPSPGLPLHATPWTAILPHLCSPCSRTLLPLSFPGSSLAECDEWDDISLVLCWPGLAAPAHLPSSVSLSVCLSASVCLSLSIRVGLKHTASHCTVKCLKDESTYQLSYF